MAPTTPIILTQLTQQAIIDNYPAMVFLKDLEGCYRVVNRRFEQQLRLESGQALGRSDRDLFPHRLAQTFQAQDRQVLASGRPLQTEYTLRRRQGVLTYLTTQFPVRDQEGRIMGVGGITTDISAFKDAQHEQDRAARLRGALEMAGAACHELNQPLQAVLSFCELLHLEMADHTGARARLDGILNQVRRLADITHRLNRITRYETREYLGDRIIDIDKASQEREPE